MLCVSAMGESPLPPRNLPWPQVSGATEFTTTASGGRERKDLSCDFDGFLMDFYGFLMDFYGFLMDVYGFLMDFWIGFFHRIFGMVNSMQIPQLAVVEAYSSEKD